MAKVMIIDDSSVIRKAAEAYLKVANHECVSAEDGFSAFAVMAKSNPDIIFVDVMMPRIDGYQFLQMVRANPKLANVPIVILSSKDGVYDQAKGRHFGATEYLTKPFSRDGIIEVVKKYVTTN